MHVEANRVILLVGANGQVGRELLSSLDSCGQVVPAVRGNGYASFGHQCQHLDLANPAETRRLVRDVRPQLIVNAAAYTAVEAAERDQAMAMVVNGVAPGILAEEAAKVGATLIHYSTDYVFDGTGQKPWTENDSPSPLNVYGETKLAGEEAVRASGGSYLIIRTSWVYGIFGQNFVKKILASSDRNELPIVDDQVGAPTSARFIAQATTAILETVQHKTWREFPERGAMLHVACGGETTWYGFAKEILEQALGAGLLARAPAVYPVSSGQYGASAARPRNSRLDTERLRRAYRVKVPDWRDEFRENLPKLIEQHQAEVTSRSPGTI